MRVVCTYIFCCTTKKYTYIQKRTLLRWMKYEKQNSLVLEISCLWTSSRMSQNISDQCVTCYVSCAPSRWLVITLVWYLDTVCGITSMITALDEDLNCVFTKQDNFLYCVLTYYARALYYKKDATRAFCIIRTAAVLLQCTVRQLYVISYTSKIHTNIHHIFFIILYIIIP